MSSFTPCCTRQILTRLCGGNDPYDIDDKLKKKIQLTLLLVVESFSEALGNWWFVAHLTDLLHHCGQLDSPPIRFEETFVISSRKVVYNHRRLKLQLWDNNLAKEESWRNYKSLDRNITSAPRSSKYSQIINKNTSFYFHSVSLVVWPPTMLNLALVVLNNLLMCSRREMCTRAVRNV